MSRAPSLSRACPPCSPAPAVRMEVQRERDVYSAFEELQGDGGIFYTGEFVNGLSVTLQSEGVDALVGAHFS